MYKPSSIVHNLVDFNYLISGSRYDSISMYSAADIDLFFDSNYP
jgi:hypothetical protein